MHFVKKEDKWIADSLLHPTVQAFVGDNVLSKSSKQWSLHWLNSQKETSRVKNVSADCLTFSEVVPENQSKQET